MLTEGQLREEREAPIKQINVSEVSLDGPRRLILKNRGNFELLSGRRVGVGGVWA